MTAAPVEVVPSSETKIETPIETIEAMDLGSESKKKTPEEMQDTIEQAKNSSIEDITNNFLSGLCE
jgi:FtsZ-binding cell division protein ZapB